MCGQAQPLDVRSWVGGVAVFRLLGLCITEADDVEVRSRGVDEEVCADALGGFLDATELDGGCTGRVYHSAGGVEESGDGTDGGGSGSQVGAAGVVLGAFTESYQDELHVRRWRLQDAGWLSQAGEVASGSSGVVSANCLIGTAAKVVGWGGQDRRSESEGCEDGGGMHLD